MIRKGASAILLVASAVMPLRAFEGDVVLADGRPVADAAVSVVGRAGVAHTDAAGRFRLEPDPVPPFAVVVVLPGGEVARAVRVERLPIGEVIRVVAVPIASEDVTVTAEAAPHLEATPAAALALLSRQELEQRRPERLVDAVQAVPGAGQVGWGHQAVPSLRGLARGRTLVLLDGGRVTSERRAGPSATFVDAGALEAVEIVRGPGSVAYGSDAFGGVILARGPRAERGAPLRFRFEGELAAGLPQAGARLEMSQGFERGGLVVQARARAYGDYRSPEGEVENSEASDAGVYARFDHEWGPGEFWTAVRGDVGRDVERPAASGSSTLVSDPREDSYRLSFGYRTDPFGGSTTAEWSAFAGSYRVVTEQKDALDASVTAVSDVDANDYGLRGRMTAFFPGRRVEAGLDIHGREDLRADGEVLGVPVTSIEDADATEAALYGSAEGSVGRTVLSGGLRVARAVSSNRGGYWGDRTSRHTPVSGFAAATVNVGRGWSVALQAARGFREPTLSDRYFVGPTGRGFAIGNPELEPETSRQADAVVRWSGRVSRSSLYGFAYRIDDLVQRRLAASDPDIFVFENVGQATIQGLEWDLQVPLGSRFGLGVGAHRIRGTAEDGSWLADIPADTLRLQVRAALGRSADVELRWLAVAADDRPGPAERVVPGHAVFDLAAGYRPWRDVEFRVVLGNLLDASFPASSDERATTAPGRTAVLAVALSVSGTPNQEPRAFNAEPISLGRTNRMYPNDPFPSVTQVAE